MRKAIRTFIILGTAALGLTLTGCGSSTPIDLSTLTPAQSQSYAAALTPAQLQAYTAALTPAQIQTIAGSLTIAQLQAIAPFLSSVTGSAGGAAATPNGTALYNSNCANCHGALANSNKPGASAARTQNAIISNSGGMGSLSFLSAADVQAITTALAGTGTTGGGSNGGSTGHPFGWTNPESSHRNYVEDNGTAGCISCHSLDQSSKGQSMSCFNCHGDEWGGGGEGGDDD